MDSLRIDSNIMSEMVNYCRSSRPNEACGLLVGRDDIVHGIIPIDNVSNNPQVHYTMSPIVLLKSLKQIDADSLELVGTFHSHPNSSPIPSSTDVWEGMKQLPNVIHIIIGLRYPQAEIQAWRFNQNNDAEKVHILVGDAKAQTIAPMSNTQKVIFVIMTLIGVLLLLGISLMLLPPAPPIAT